MKQTVDKSTFVDTFDQYGRSDNFTRAAREALFEYYEELEDDMGESIEFDCISICCDWSECANASDWADGYESEGSVWRAKKDHDHIPQEIETYWLTHLQDNTQVIEFNGGILVASF